MFQFTDVLGVFKYAFPFDQHQVPFGKECFRDGAPSGFGDDDIDGGEVVMSVEGFDGELDNGGVDAASVENAWAVIGFNAGDEVVADEANLCSWDRQFEGQKHQVVFDQEVEFGVYFPEAGDDGLGKS